MTNGPIAVTNVGKYPLAAVRHRKSGLGHWSIASTPHQRQPRTTRPEAPCWKFAILAKPIVAGRSEEHTSELQSLMRISYAVFCLKKKKIKEHNKSQNENIKYSKLRAVEKRHNRHVRTT